MSAGAPTRPVLRYHGGKWRLAPWIVAQFPPHRVYIEPFGGAASVLLRKPPSYAEVYNDLWGEVVSLFRVLRDPLQAAELERLLRLTPYAREEWESCGETCEEPVERARRMLVRSFQGFGTASARAGYSTGWRASSNRSGTTPSGAGRHFPEQIAAFTARLQGVTIEQRPALQVIERHDGHDALHYVDPPYVHETRDVRDRNKTYVHELLDADHEALAAVLRQARGMVILSGYRCPLYDRLYGGWRRLERQAFADGARPRLECLWLNDAAAAWAPGLFAAEAC